MIGDDVPDESALEAAVRHGGMGLRVAGEHFREQADFRNPSDVRTWLAPLADKVATEPGKRREPSLPLSTRDRNAQG